LSQRAQPTVQWSTHCLVHCVKRVGLVLTRAATAAGSERALEKYNTNDDDDDDEYSVPFPKKNKSAEQKS